MPEINNLDDWLISVLKPDEKTIKAEIEYFESKKEHLEIIINQINSLVVNKKDVPFSLINEFTRCFPYFPSVSTLPLDYFENRRKKIKELKLEIKKRFKDYQIDFNKSAPKNKQKIYDTYLGHSGYVDSIYKGQLFIQFIDKHILFTYYDRITGYSNKQKEQIIKDILKHIQTFQAIKGSEFEELVFAGYIANTLGLFPTPVKMKADWIEYDFRRALYDKMIYLIKRKG